MSFKTTLALATILAITGCHSGVTQSNTCADVHNDQLIMTKALPSGSDLVFVQGAPIHLGRIRELLEAAYADNLVEFVPIRMELRPAGAAPIVLWTHLKAVGKWWRSGSDFDVLDVLVEPDHDQIVVAATEDYDLQIWSVNLSQGKAYCTSPVGWTLRAAPIPLDRNNLRVRLARDRVSGKLTAEVAEINRPVELGPPSNSLFEQNDGKWEFKLLDGTRAASPAR